MDLVNYVCNDNQDDVYIDRLYRYYERGAAGYLKLRLAKKILVEIMERDSFDRQLVHLALSGFDNTWISYPFWKKCDIQAKYASGLGINARISARTFRRPLENHAFSELRVRVSPQDESNKRFSISLPLIGRIRSCVDDLCSTPMTEPEARNVGA